MRSIGALAILCTAACGGSSSFSDAAPSPDAHHVADATPVPDAQNSDDAPTADAAPTGTVTLRAAQGTGVPIVGGKVVFLDAADNVVSDTVTDASGVASASMASGGSVLYLQTTPAFGGTQIANIYAWTDVQAGDTVYYGRPTASPMTVDILLPSNANATSFSALTPCGSGTSTTTTISVGVCNGDNDIYIEADDAGGFIGGFLETGIVLTSTATVDFSNATWAGDRQVTATLTNPPADATSTTLFASLRGGAIPVGIGTLQTPTPGTSYNAHDIAGELVYDVFYQRSGQSPHNLFASDAESDAVTIDMANPIPDSPTGTFDVASGTVTFNAGTTIAHTVVHLHGVRGASGYVDWYVSQPGDATSVHVPHLSAPHDGANLVTTDNPTAHVQIFTVDSAATETALAAHPFDVALPLVWLAPGGRVQASN